MKSRFLTKCLYVIIVAAFTGEWQNYALADLPMAIQSFDALQSYNDSTQPLLDYPPVIETFQASMTSISTLQPVRIWWTTRGGPQVDIYDGALNTTYANLGIEGFIDVYPKRTTTYTLILTGADQQKVTRQLTITALIFPQVEYFYSSLPMVERGQVSEIRWKTSNASRVDLIGGIPFIDAQNLPFEGIVPVGPTENSIYTLRVTGFDGQTRQTNLCIHVRQN